MAATLPPYEYGQCVMVAKMHGQLRDQSGDLFASICGAVGEGEKLCTQSPQHRGRCWEPGMYRARLVRPGFWVVYP